MSSKTQLSRRKFGDIINQNTTNTRAKPTPKPSITYKLATKSTQENFDPKCQSKLENNFETNQNNRLASSTKWITEKVIEDITGYQQTIITEQLSAMKETLKQNKQLTKQIDLLREQNDKLELIVEELDWQMNELSDYIGFDVRQITLY